MFKKRYKFFIISHLFIDRLKRRYFFNIEIRVSLFSKKESKEQKKKRILKTFLLRKIIPSILKTWIYPTNIQKYPREHIFGHPYPRTLKSKKICESKAKALMEKWYKVKKNEWKEINDDKGSDRFKGSHVGDFFRRKRGRIARISSFSIKAIKHLSLSTLEQLQTNNE